MTHNDLTQLQIEISELEKENQNLKERLQDLEVNLSYVEQQLSEKQDAPKHAFPVFSVNKHKLSVV